MSQERFASRSGASFDIQLGDIDLHVARGDQGFQLGISKLGDEVGKFDPFFEGPIPSGIDPRIAGKGYVPIMIPSSSYPVMIPSDNLRGLIPSEWDGGVIPSGGHYDPRVANPDAGTDDEGGLPKKTKKGIKEYEHTTKEMGGEKSQDSAKNFWDQIKEAWNKSNDALSGGSQSGGGTKK